MLAAVGIYTLIPPDLDSIDVTEPIPVTSTGEAWDFPALLGGVLLASLGALLVDANPRSDRSPTWETTRIVLSVMAGVFCYALLAPSGWRGGCTFGPGGNSCEIDSWSNVLGMNFDGDPNYLPRIAAGFAVALVTWLFLHVFVRGEVPRHAEASDRSAGEGI